MAGRYDNPDTINAFLRLIDATPLTDSPNARASVSELQTSLQSALVAQSKPESDSAPESNTTSVDASPAPGIRAPPSTPVSQAVAADKITHLDPIEDDDKDWLDESPKGTSTKENNGVPVVSAGSPAMMDTPTRPVLGPVSTNLTSTQHKLLFRKEPGVDDEVKPAMLAELEKQAQGYMDNVLEKFRKSKAALFTDAQAQAEAKAQKHLNEAIANHSATLAQAEVETKSDCSTIPFPDFVDASVSTGGMVLPNEDKTVQHIEVLPYHSKNTPSANPPSTSETMVKEDVGDNNINLATTITDSGSVTFDQANSPTIVVTASTETDRSVGSDRSIQGIGHRLEEHIEDDSENQQEEDSDEDREHRTHFKSWGAPGIRNKQKSRIRTVVLIGLPSTADLTLVHSLVHGGTIEVMRLTPASPESTTINAHITFTSGDACDKYFDKYPNGMDVRHQGKKYPVLVKRSDNVDIISSMMQGYLDCGATRVVKVTGADDDWGIVALNRFAEGKNKTRAVEAVTDTYRNGERIIHFRFGNITDAVKFKGILIRSFEWEGCPVDFAEDPCSRATGLHYD
ncbi:hypothetical protein PV11_03878 [Exophiala sideris]|uniref:RRM domain-containing protein n=1 Tax=Exophiala sideris TaxID=1016849 RepID=A0A0D1VZ53_9EURO|nr:hypothetical protein PV11_03878 [Exophiala sideris]